MPKCLQGHVLAESAEVCVSWKVLGLSLQEISAGAVTWSKASFGKVGRGRREGAGCSDGRDRAALRRALRGGGWRAGDASPGGDVLPTVRRGLWWGAGGGSQAPERGLGQRRDSESECVCGGVYMPGGWGAHEVAQGGSRTVRAGMQAT